MKVFLDKLASALHNGTNKLAKDDNEDTALRSLVLKTTFDLPKPLKPLEWSFTLWPQAASELAATILRPALHQLSMAQQKLESIFDVVKDKDHVIERLLDRVAEKGVDMSLIFPTLTGTSKRGGSGVKVEEARKLVPGMKGFDRHSWERCFREDATDSKAETGLSELVTGCERCFIHSEEDHAESMSSWVQKLPGAETLESGVLKSFLGRSQSQGQSQSRSIEDTESENEFETQATPPQSKKRSSPEAANDNGFVSDGQRATKRAKTGGAKLGALGRNSRSKSKTPVVQEKKESSSPGPPAKAHSPPNRRKSDTSTATATASESDDEPQEKASRQSPSKTSRFGGFMKLATVSKSPPSQRPSSPQRGSTTAKPDPSTPSRRLGRLGKAGQSTATASAVPESAETGQRSETDGQKAQPSQPVTPSRKLGRIGMRSKGKANEVTQAHDGKEGSASPASTNERDKPTLDLSRKQSKSAAAEKESDATASPSPSPSPTHPHLKIKSPPSQPISPNSKYKDPESRPSSSSTDISDRIEGKEDKKEPETEEQKAARRRDELKRTIQASGPKKKRRF